ncbi:hypothetical protein ACFL14_02050 [Patescibacteria group bacterium]
MKQKLDFSRLSGCFSILAKIILILAVIGIIYFLYTQKIWTLPMGLVDLFKNEPITAGIFAGIIVLGVVGLAIFHKKSGGGFG